MSMDPKKSILLVTVDCLRADHAGFLGYGRPTTPFLDSLAGESFVFPSAIVAGAPTYYSFPAILASRYPLALGRDLLGLAPDEPSLASVLKGAGYATAAFCAANPYISSRFGYDQGFDIFQDYLGADLAPLPSGESAIASHTSWRGTLNRGLSRISHTFGPAGAVYDEFYFQYRQRVTPAGTSLDALRRFPAADVIVGDALAWLASTADTPFFLWLHLMDPHSPYYPGDAALEMMDQKDITPFRARYLNCYWNRSDLRPRRLARHRDEIVALYDAGVRWVDAQMHHLVDRLRQTGRWDDCILAFTADHGEEFLDHGGRYHPPSGLMEELIHVPLLVRVPGTPGGRLQNSPLSLLHLAPTLLDAAGLALPPEFQGSSFWWRMQQEASWEDAAIAECVTGCTNPFRRENRLGPRMLAVRENRYKLTLSFDPRAEHLYDLEADPREQAPLPGDVEKAVRRRLLDRAREHLARAVTTRDQGTRLQTILRELRLELTRPSQENLKSMRL
jgi:arylsulfatase A-like enzyme